MLMKDKEHSGIVRIKGSSGAKSLVLMVDPMSINIAGRFHISTFFVAIFKSLLDRYV